MNLVTLASRRKLLTLFDPKWSAVNTQRRQTLALVEMHVKQATSPSWRLIGRCNVRGKDRPPLMEISGSEKKDSDMPGREQIVAMDCEFIELFDEQNVNRRVSFPARVTVIDWCDPSIGNELLSWFPPKRIKRLVDQVGEHSCRSFCFTS